MLRFIRTAVFSLACLMSTAALSAEKTDRVVLTKSNVVTMDQVYSDESVAAVMLKIQEADAKLAPWQPIYLLIFSPGGSIEAGLELIDNINSLKRTVHTVTMFGASMAFQNVQGVNGKRYITKTGTLMSHKAKGGFQGEFPGQLDSRYQFYLNRLAELDKKTVSRTGGKYTLQSYQAAYENEFWCEGQGCVDKGMADEAVYVACDASLQGTATQQMKVSFMGMSINLTVTKAACPTITAILDVKADVGGKKLEFQNGLETWARQLNISVDKASELKSFLEKTIQDVGPIKSRKLRENNN